MKTFDGEEIDRSLSSVNYTEFTQKKKPTAGIVLIRMGIIALCIAIVTVFSLVLWYLGAISALIVAIVIWFLWPLTNIEYEYVTSSGEIKFSVVYGGKRKKTVLSEKIKNFEKIAPYTEPIKADTVYDFRTSAKQKEDIYYASFTENSKSCIVIFRCTNKALKIFSSYNKDATVKADNLRY